MEMMQSYIHDPSLAFIVAWSGGGWEGRGEGRAAGDIGEERHGVARRNGGIEERGEQRERKREKVKGTEG